MLSSELVVGVCVCPREAIFKDLVSDTIDVFIECYQKGSLEAGCDSPEHSLCAASEPRERPVGALVTFLWLSTDQHLPPAPAPPGSAAAC